jgi:hypothetical protein
MVIVAVKRGDDAVFSLLQAEQQPFEPVDPVDEPEDVEGDIQGQMLQERRQVLLRMGRVSPNP